MQIISTNFSHIFLIFENLLMKCLETWNKSAKWQSYLKRCTGGESEKLYGNDVANPKNCRYHWWHRKKRIMKDGSSLIIVDNYATWTTWLPAGARYVRPRWQYAGENWKRSFISTIRSTVHTNPSRKRSFSKTLYKPEEFQNAFMAL